MWTLEQAIEYHDKQAEAAKNHGYSGIEETNNQYAAWLRELQEYKKADNCEGCKHNNDADYICLICKRYYGDKYAAERRTDGQG